MATMRSKKDRAVTSLAVAGTPYEPDESGLFEIADEHITVAQDHGLELVPAKPAVKVEQKPEPKAKK